MIDVLRSSAKYSSKKKQKLTDSITEEKKKDFCRKEREGPRRKKTHKVKELPFNKSFD